MAKLKLLLDKSLDEDETFIIHYKNLMSKIEEKTDEGKTSFIKRLNQKTIKMSMFKTLTLTLFQVYLIVCASVLLL